MSDVFAAWGIKSVAPAAIKTYSADRGLWFARYFRQLKEDMGPSAWRGDAVEAGFNAVLHGRPNAHMIAAQQFEHRSMEWTKANRGEIHPETDEEFGKVATCLERAIAALESEPVLKEAGKPSSSQGRCEVLLPGAPVPLTGYWDWGFGKVGEGFSLDLKTSKTLPSEPDEDNERAAISPDHGIQFSCYAKSRGEKTASGLYVLAAPFASGWTTKEVKGETRWYHKATKKRLRANPETPDGAAHMKELDDEAAAGRRTHILVTLNERDIEFYCNAAVEAMRSMEALLTAAIAMTEYEFTTKEAALARLCRPNLLATGGGHYQLWKPDYTRAAAEAVPEWGLME